MSWFIISLLLVGVVNANVAVPPNLAERFCSTRAPGIYGLGCSPFFIICDIDGASMRRCRGQLYFDESVLNCVPKEQSNYCRVDGELLPNREAVVMKRKMVHPQAFTCVGKTDGVYKQFCSGLFVVCSREQATFFVCPNGMFYDGVTAKCQEKLLGCAVQPEKKLPVFPRKPITAFSCNDVDDGYYPQLDEEFIIKCSAGRGTLLHCQKGFVLNPHEKICVEMPSRKKRYALYPYWANAAYLTGAYANFDAFGGFHGITTNGLVSALSYYPSCAGLTYGVHSFGCSGYYLVALPNYCFMYMCPESYVYDTTLQQCAPQTAVVACNIHITHPVAPVVTAAPKPVLQVTTVLPVIVSPPTPVLLGYDCSYKADGPYSLGCSETFVMCANGVAKPLACSAGLKYDAISGRCLKKAFVVQCGGKPTPIPCNTCPTPKPRILPLPVLTCHGKADGIYSLGCHESFYACVAGAPTIMDCPSGLVFDDVSARCLERPYVTNCGGVPTPPPVQPVAVKSCSNYLGVISKRCHSFTICLHNGIREYACPAGHYFDMSLYKCVVQKFRDQCR